ncbi:GPI-anchored surface protein, putative [Bodo saltans]|uniref:GPI-anchored surface protein, putative n=1 Tax=Bodo saltans TaxID=75058 RepID=A0A0S4J4M0_BODSA|nr:GPI-anchored surface protein, putative [Bodo saltans]|eukprot:CUG70974.1 GPI-anchored surface protein, putative [Bodo saltans]
MHFNLTMQNVNLFLESRGRRQQKMHSIFVTACVVLLMLLLLAASHVEGASTPIPSCVNDPASSSILQNTTMSYFEKVALFYSNRDTESKYRLRSRKNSTSSAPPAAPYLCPQLAPSNVFVPGTYWNFYFDHSAVSDIQNATTEGVTCGLSCSSKSTGVSFDTVGKPTAYHLHVAYGPVTRIINGTSVTRNETYNTDNETTVFCAANVPNTTALDTVCIAHIQYNSTYSESGTGFALPSVGLFAAAILDPANTTLSAGVASTFSIWFPPSLTFCPWYYDAGTLLNNTQNEPTTLAEYFLPRVAPSITIGLVYTLNTASLANNTTIWSSESRTFPFIGARCEVASPHPTSGGVGVRYFGEIPTVVANMEEYDGVYLQQNNGTTVTSFNMVDSGLPACVLQAAFAIALLRRDAVMVDN